MEPSHLGGDSKRVSGSETRVYPGSAHPLEENPTSYFVYIDGGFDYKEGVTRLT